MDASLEQLAVARPQAEDAIRWRIGGRIAYVLSHALPFSSNGDAVRSHGLAAALAAQGFEVCVFTRPGHPWNLPGFVGPYASNQHTLDGVRYIHPDKPADDSGENQVSADAEIYAEWFRVFKPSAVVTTSEAECALPALLAARRTGIPFVYEARGFADRAEADAVAQAADRIVTLSQPMAEELVRRGAVRSNIGIIPHAVSVLPERPAKDMRLARKLGLNRSRVVAYLGSLDADEGLDDLLAACGQLRQQGLAVKLLVVGASNPLVQTDADDPAIEHLHGLAQTVGLAGHVVFRHRVSHGDIGPYYAQADVIAIPRKASPAAAWVLPLKAVEALAYGRPLVVSAVGPLAELVAKTNLGIGFRPGDCGELAVALRLALEDKAWCHESGEQSRRWVAGQRLWQSAVQPLVAQLQQIGVKPVAERDAPPAPCADARGKLRVAAVMDEFTEHSFAPECELLQLRPDIWHAQLDAFKPDLLFIESAWEGVDGLWRGKVALDRQVLAAVVACCKPKQIPTLFWNKEDPVYFDTLLATAALFDFVFTTDIDCIPRYKTALRHDRVFLLPFACQPARHNPIEKYTRKDAFCFAGSYYAYFAERTRDLGHLVTQLANIRPVEIFDRRNGQHDDINHQFPAEYHPYVVGTLPFDQIDKAYKGYRYAVNLNSVKQSQTMFARRVYELLASNTLTVSNFSRGLRLFFGDLVISSDDGAEIVRRLRPFADDAETGGKLRLAGLRKVMREHTYAHRLAYAAGKALGRPTALPLPSVLVLAQAADRAELDALLGHWRRQRYAEAHLLIVADAALAEHLPEDLRASQLPPSALEGKTLGDITGGAQWLAGLLAEDYYGPHYLLDIALATRYSPALAIGKRGHYACGEQGVVLREAERVYRHSGELPARSAAIDCKQIAHEGVLAWLGSLPQRVYQVDGALAIDPYNYCRSAGTTPQADIAARVDDLALHTTGLNVCAVQQRAEAIRARQPFWGWPQWRTATSGPANVKTHLRSVCDGQTSATLEQAEYLLLTNQYPAYGDIYRNGFVHTRVKAYQQQGFRVDVFCLREDQSLGYHEFENVDVVTGPPEALYNRLASGGYHSVLVHFLDADMWEVLQAFTDRLQIVVWAHGFEIQPWWRRQHDCISAADQHHAQQESGKRMAFWRSVLQPMPENLKLVFVSRCFAEEVMKDYGLRIPESQYQIIHNPIDTTLFSYQEKHVEHRKKILSIRSFASRKYANDLSVEVIRLLAKKPWFDDLQIKIVGDGTLFDETLAPLRQYKNVIIEKRFLTHAEIAMLHQEYGIFLCPTRGDSQGVSRDEAMSSGLVPVTTTIAAIPEFVDRKCGILAPPEDAQAMANGIAQLYESPSKFIRLSQNAAERVRRQSGSGSIIAQEMAWASAVGENA